MQERDGRGRERGEGECAGSTSSARKKAHHGESESAGSNPAAPERANARHHPQEVKAAAPAIHPPRERTSNAPEVHRARGNNPTAPNRAPRGAPGSTTGSNSARNPPATEKRGAHRAHNTGESESAGNRSATAPRERKCEGIARAGKEPAAPEIHPPRESGGTHRAHTRGKRKHQRERRKQRAEWSERAGIDRAREEPVTRQESQGATSSARNPHQPAGIHTPTPVTHPRLPPP